MIYVSNLFRKDNPRGGFGNAAETTKVPYPTTDLLTAAVSVGTPAVGIASATDWVRGTCGICVSWLIGLPRRAGARWYAMNDAEAGWSGWIVLDRHGGLGRQYRDTRFRDLT
jgi:hypothetical protein